MRQFQAVVASFLLAGSLQAGAVLSASKEKIVAERGELVRIDFSIENNSSFLLSSGKNFYLSYHLYAQNGKILAYENRRWKLPVSVFPGRKRSFALPVFFSHAPGVYLLEWELLREGDFWGKSRGWTPARQKLFLKDLAQVVPEKFSGLEKKPGRQERTLLALIGQTLKNSEFELRKGLPAFRPGSDYPQFWVRDFASVILAARYFYPPETSARLLEFLLLEFEKGGARDWYDTAGESGLNSAASDQQSSLVLAAAALHQVDKKWARGKLAGKSLIERLDQVLEDLFLKRFEAGSGLIRSGYTIDWGDVSREFPDQRALYMSDHSEISYNIFFQARAIRAMRALEKLAADSGRASLGQKWEKRRKILEESCRAKLFIKDKGYFRIRWQQKFSYENEEKLLALGGNCEAMLAGIFRESEKIGFFKTFFKMKRELGLSSSSFTLLPPYRKGFFPYHLLRRPYQYQNGGLWDWIGARMLRLLYENGFQKEGEAMLAEIKARTLKEMTFWEWYDRGMHPRGAFSYAAAAGELFDALLVRANAWRSPAGNSPE